SSLILLHHLVSTVFPYTTLFRSPSPRGGRCAVWTGVGGAYRCRTHNCTGTVPGAGGGGRAGGCSQRGCGGGCHDEGMDLRTLLREIGARIVPDPAPAMGWWLLLALVAALGAVLLPPLWRLARLAVTIVHELGHAAVGILMGRRFTGFVVSADMSGHAITVGPRRGVGRIASTWAGYPAPAVVGAV